MRIKLRMSRDFSKVKAYGKGACSAGSAALAISLSLALALVPCKAIMAFEMSPEMLEVQKAFGSSHGYQVNKGLDASDVSLPLAVARVTISAS